MFNIDFRYKIKNLSNNLSQSMFEMSTPAFTQAQILFVKLSMALLIESCGSWAIFIYLFIIPHNDKTEVLTTGYSGMKGHTN